ncbi:MAG: hypothetical protein JWN55_2458, partial [Frankiales bacterium]|nr:hypothetical protein [Frankiales bacterium]
MAVVATGVAVALLSGGSGGQAPPVLHLTGAARDAVA